LNRIEKSFFCLAAIALMQGLTFCSSPPMADETVSSDVLALLGLQASAMQDNVSLVPLRRATFVQQDPESYVDDFSYMAAVPFSIFSHDSSRYMSPLIYNDDSYALDCLIEDWMEYLEPDTGNVQLSIVGNMSSSDAIELSSTAGGAIYPWVTGSSSAEIAARLALSEWSTSDIAVFALSQDEFEDNSIATGQADKALAGLSTTVLTPALSISSNDPVTLSFDVPSDAAWIEGSINWTGTPYFTHVLVDANGRPVDYSVRSQTYWERRYPYLDAAVPLYFWVPNTGDGEWGLTIYPQDSSVSGLLNFDCKISLHPGFTQSISVPADAKSLSVSATWDNTATDLNLALLDPSGRLVQWNPAGSIVTSPGRADSSVDYPRAGNWTVVVAWMNANGEQNNVDLSWQIETLPADLQGYLESAANGAVLASLLNAPLLYVDRDSVPAITQFAAERLGVSTSFLVDPANLHTTAVYNALDTFSAVANLYNYQLVSQWIRSLSDSEAVILSVPVGGGSELLAAAAYSGAYHGAPVFSMCGDDNLLTTRAEETWFPYLIGPEIDIYITSRYSTRTENGWYDERIPNRYSMLQSATTFEDFLDDRGAFNSSTVQPVVIVSPTSLVKPSFDRSIQSHFSSGRIPAESPALASVMINRGSLHAFLFRTAENSDRTLVTMYAYTQGSAFIDNRYDYHMILQYENTTSLLESADFSVDSHVGYEEVFAGLSSQPALWALSTHGTLTRYPTDPPRRPDGTGLFSLRSVDAPYASESSTERDANGDQIVNPVQFEAEAALHRIESTDTLKQSVTRIGSPIIILTACLLGGSVLPATLMEQGAVAVMASPRTVYFQSAAMVSLFVLEGLTSGNSTGASLSRALALVSSDYTDPLPQEPRDYANQHILYGDPSVRLYNPNVTPRTLSVDPMTLTLDERTPGRGVKEVAAFGISRYLPDTFVQLGVDFDYYSSSNYTEFGDLLPLRRCVVTEPGALETLSTHVAEGAAIIKDYVRKGGVLVLMGVSGNLDWIPWPVSYCGTGLGSTIDIVDSEHPLMSLPNALSETVEFNGTLCAVWDNYSVLAVTNGNPVIIATAFGVGKVAITTTRPVGPERNTTVANIVAWGDMPSLLLHEIEKNEEVIWAGDRVVITALITDRVGNEVAGASLRAWMNSTEVTSMVQEVGLGTYTIVLDENWTSNSLGRYALRLHVTKPGHDTLDIVLPRYVYVRPSPWPAILVGAGAVAAVTVAYLYLKHRRGEGVLHRPRIARPAVDRRSREAERLQREEEKRKKEEQKKRDTEFDAREALGV